MRTLKKALCLVLVLSMVMGIGVIGAGAAYSDADQIEYQEAVDVMTAIGVMQGVGENTFDPDGTFTRAQAAKMLSYMILGETAAEALPTRSDFTDVSADQWFSKYIGYGVQEGYLAGMGDGTFKPDDPVTGYQWAKMLLCALGYDAKTEGLEGNGYEINVAKLVLTKVKLFEGNEGANYNANATREEAALYAFNALNQQTVHYASTTTVVINGVEVVIGNGEAVGDWDDNGQTDPTLFRETYFGGASGLIPTTTTDAFKREAVKWEYDNKEIGTYATETPVATYTTAVKGGKLYTDLGKPSSPSVTYYLDGQTQSAVTIASGNTTEIGGAGILLEVYKDGNAITIIGVSTYVANIETWTEAELDDNGDVISGQEEKITIDDIYPGANNLDFETTAFTEDDEDTWVLYTYVSGAGVQSVTKPTIVSDVSVTGYTDTTITAGGTTYTKAATSSRNNYLPTFAAGNTYDLYLDTYGNVIAAKVHTEAATAPSYIYVTDVEAEAQTSQVVTEKAGYVAVEGVLANGETVVKYLEVKTSSAANKPEAGYAKGENYVTIEGIGNAADTYLKLDAATVESLNSDNSPNANLKPGMLFTYEESGESIILGKANTDGSTANETVGSTSYYSQVLTSGTFGVKKNVATVTGASGYVNSSTNLVLVDGSTVTTMSGYANFPTNEVYSIGTDADAVVVLKAGNYITDIIVIGAEATVESDNVIAAYMGTNYSAVVDDTYVTYYEFYVNGEVKGYEVNDAGTTLASVAKGDIVELSFTDGVVDSATEVTDSATVLTDQTASVGYAVTDVTADYILVDGTAIVPGTAAVYDIDDDNADNWTAGTVEKDDVITVVYDTDDQGTNTATVIFITQKG